MKIAFTGGGTGGHFYPLIAIAEAVQDLAREERLIMPQLYFLAPAPFDEKALFENQITFIKIPAGKLRRYASAANLTSWLATLMGTLKALSLLLRIYPDVVISKGGYGSVPTVLAAHFLRIPIIVHESDAKPGRANLLAARYAAKIAITFDSAAKYFPKGVQKRIARTGMPVRKALARVEKEGAQQYLGLDKDVPTVLILGGSQGSQRINDTVLRALPELVETANVIHQTGTQNFKETKGIAAVALQKSPHADRYHPFDYLSALSLERAAGAADVVVSRAGAGTLAEIALWKKPAIIIPIPEAVSHDQKLNAYAYAGTGAGEVIEEENLSPNLLVSEVRRILHDSALAKKMGDSAEGFTDPDAAKVIAKEALSIALSHE